MADPNFSEASISFSQTSSSSNHGYRQLLMEIAESLREEDVASLCFVTELPITDGKMKAINVLRRLSEKGTFSIKRIDKLEALLMEIKRHDLVNGCVATFKESYGASRLHSSSAPLHPSVLELQSKRSLSLTDESSPRRPRLRKPSSELMSVAESEPLDFTSTSQSQDNGDLQFPGDSEVYSSTGAEASYLSDTPSTPFQASFQARGAENTDIVRTSSHDGCTSTTVHHNATVGAPLSDTVSEGKFAETCDPESSLHQFPNLLAHSTPMQATSLTYTADRPLALLSPRSMATSLGVTRDVRDEFVNSSAAVPVEETMQCSTATEPGLEASTLVLPTCSQNTNMTRTSNETESHSTGESTFLPTGGTLKWRLARSKLYKPICKHDVSKFVRSDKRLVLLADGIKSPQIGLRIIPYGVDKDRGEYATLEADVYIPAKCPEQFVNTHCVRLSVKVFDDSALRYISKAEIATFELRKKCHQIPHLLGHDVIIKESSSVTLTVEASAQLLANNECRYDVSLVNNEEFPEYVEVRK